MRRRPLGLALAAVATAALAVPGAVAAQTLTVETESQTGTGSLREAIVDAGRGDRIVLPAGDFVLDGGQQAIDEELEIVGAGEELTTLAPSGDGSDLDQLEAAGRLSDLTVVEGGALADGSGIETKVQIVAIAITLAILLIVLELVRRRRLAERYALLWMLAVVAMLVLAVWRDGLDVLADAIGIAEPANALFIVAFGVSFVLLLHFSVATSRLGEETKILAQEVARLELELREERGEVPAPNGRSTSAAVERGEDEGPVAAQTGPQ